MSPERCVKGESDRSQSLAAVQWIASKKLRRCLRRNYPLNPLREHPEPSVLFPC
jgi:hypothetical protein